jgi:hypothetical protein
MVKAYKWGDKMYKYKYVKATLGGFLTEANHHEIIDLHARAGWRLVQVLPMYYNAHGKPTEYEIIFELKMEE